MLKKRQINKSLDWEVFRLRKSLSAIILALTLSLVILLSGCSSLIKMAATNAVKGAASKAGIDYNDKTGGVTISTSSGSAQIGGTISWPKDWPSELPKMSGTLTFCTDTNLKSGGGIELMITVKNQDVVKKYADTLASMGYSKVIESTTSNSYSVAYANSKYTIELALADDNTATIVVGQGTGESSSTSSADSSGTSSSDSSDDSSSNE
jgi:uncharacterized protein YceK